MLERRTSNCIHTFLRCLLLNLLTVLWQAVTAVMLFTTFLWKDASGICTPFSAVRKIAENDSKFRHVYHGSHRTDIHEI
jgi:hypothetical protein